MHSTHGRQGRPLAGRFRYTGWLVAFALTASAGAQGPGGLEGQALRPADDLESGVQSLVGTLLGATPGVIEKVVVTDDRPQRLVVAVTYRGLAGHRLLGELRDRERHGRPELGRPAVTLDSADGVVELVFEPAPGAPAGAQFDIAFLRLRATRVDLPVVDLERSFRLAKSFATAVDPAQLVVRVTPRPEGAAAQLGEQPVQIALPPAQPAQAAPPAPAGPVLGRRAAVAGAQLHVLGAATEVARPASRSAAQQVVVERTAPAVQALPADRRLLQLNRFEFGLGHAITDRNGRGPGGATLDLLEGLRADIALSRDALMRVSTRVFQDQNPDSGIFYFLPQAYTVEWSADDGYGLRMLYGAATGEGAAGDVLMAARLDAGVDTAEIALATALLRAYQARHPEVKFSELRPLPIDKAPELSLAGDLAHQYEIPAEKVAVNAISDVLGEIDVSWVTDTVTKENLQLALVEDVGLNGNLTFAPAGGGVGAQAIPVRIRLADALTLGTIPWRRSQAWRNDRPYPVRLRYLHALLIENQTPIVYSWNLDGASVPPRASAEIQPAPVPAWLDGRASKMWIEYAPVESCDPCDQQVIAAITGGVTSLGASQITFHTITPLADLGAYEIAVTVRSKYFDPRTRTLQTKPALPLDADNKDFTIGPIYLVNRQPGESVPGDPLFEYQLEVAMPDGSSRRGTSWVAADGLRVLIGRVQVEQALGAAPGGAQQDPP